MHCLPSVLHVVTPLSRFDDLMGLIYRSQLDFDKPVHKGVEISEMKALV